MDTPAERPALSHSRLPAFGAAWALFLDVDGTLLELAHRPDAVVLKPHLLSTLRHVQDAVQGALALISGRGLEDLDRLFDPLRLPMAGQHGAERRDAAGRLHRPAPADPLLASARRLLGAFAREQPGVLLEDKGSTLALHYRNAPQAQAAAEALTASLLRDADGGLALQQGKMVLELKPAGIDKGTAIEAFLGEAPFRGRVPVFIGDDVTDEDGFRTVNALGGHSVKVGPGETAARFRLHDVDQVLDWLDRYTAWCRKESGP